MKRILCVLIFLFFCSPILLYSFEIGASFRFGNLAFSPDREITDLTFTGVDYFSWGISLFVAQQINDKLAFSSGFYSDPILRNISCSHVTYTENIFSVGIGPIFGFLNSGFDPLMKPGISALLRIEIPAIVFIELRADNTLNTRLSIDLDYIQERMDLSFGFFVPNAICTANIFTKKFTQLRLVEEAGEDVFYDYVDSLIEYSFHVNIFQKNVPYRLNISFGYQQLLKSYIEDTDRTDHNLNSIILGTGIELNFTPAVYFTLDVESSIYTFGQEELLGITNPGPLGYMFNTFTGISVNVDKIIQSRKIE